MKKIVLNRQAAPHLSLYDFFKLAHACGCEYVELRNDLAPFYQVCDNHTTEEVNQWLIEFGLKVLTINAVGQFNLRKDNEAFKNELESLCITAKTIGCSHLVLCPACSPDAGFEQQDSHHLMQLTQTALHHTIYPILKAHGMKGLVEPLGFSYSSFRDISVAVDLIEAQTDVFALVLDTFHFYLFNQIGQADVPFDFSNNPRLSEQYRKILPYIGLVHLSSVVETMPITQISDNERMLVVPNDILKSLDQIEALSTLGFDGFYSLEPFSSEYTQFTFDELQKEITTSMALIHSHKNK